MRESTNKYLLGELGERSDMVTASNIAFSLPIKIKSIYEWRILGLIMLKMQADFGDHKFDFRDKKDLINQKPLLDNIRMTKLSYLSGGRYDIEITFPLVFLLNRDHNNMLRGYENVKKALRNLSRAVEYENKSLRKKLFEKSDKTTGVVWGLYQIIDNVEIRKENGVSYVAFRVPDKTWSILCRWEKGVHIVELSVFFHFERPTSVPFYIFLADYRKKGEVIWATKYIKELLAPGEYRDYSAFRQRVLLPVAEDLKTHSPFYIEFVEYVDVECKVPAGKGRGKPANYIKIKILHQPGKNLAVDERIDMFIEINRLSSFKLNDLTSEELDFLTNNLGFVEIKGKNLETIVKLKYYKNYGHDSAANIWRTNPGNFFMEYLKRLYDTIMLSDKQIKSITAYALASMKDALEAYEPSEKTPQQLQEQQDTPKKEETFTPSHEQDMAWIYELARDSEWKEAMINRFELKNDKILCGYLMMFRDEMIDHPGHTSKQDLSRHFRNCMSDGDNRDGWVTLSGKKIFVGSVNEEILKKDKLIEAFGYKVIGMDSDGKIIFQNIQN